MMLPGHSYLIFDTRLASNGEIDARSQIRWGDAMRDSGVMFYMNRIQA